MITSKGRGNIVILVRAPSTLTAIPKNITKKAFSRAGFEPAPLGKGHTYPVELPFILIVTLFYRFALYLKSD